MDSLTVQWDGAVTLKSTEYQELTHQKLLFLRENAKWVGRGDQLDTLASATSNPNSLILRLRRIVTPQP